MAASQPIEISAYGTYYYIDHSIYAMATQPPADADELVLRPLTESRRISVHLDGIDYPSAVPDVIDYIHHAARPSTGAVEAKPVLDGQMSEKIATYLCCQALLLKPSPQLASLYSSLCKRIVEDIIMVHAILNAGRSGEARRHKMFTLLKLPLRLPAAIAIGDRAGVYLTALTSSQASALYSGYLTYWRVESFSAEHTAFVSSVLADSLSNPAAHKLIMLHRLVHVYTQGLGHFVDTYSL
jgi:hypothetical protein